MPGNNEGEASRATIQVPVHCAKGENGQGRGAWRSLSGRRLTKWSSAASVASPLQRRVRPLSHFGLSWLPS